jgi:hypothetical protein
VLEGMPVSTVHRQAKMNEAYPHKLVLRIILTFSLAMSLDC